VCLVLVFPKSANGHTITLREYSAFEMGSVART
jgi:hypothetical protein